MININAQNKSTFKCFNYGLKMIKLFSKKMSSFHIQKALFEHKFDE